MNFSSVCLPGVVGKGCSYNNGDKMWRNIPSYLKSSLELCSLLKNLSTFSKRKVKWLFHLVELYLFVDKVLKRPKKKKNTKYYKDL